MFLRLNANVGVKDAEPHIEELRSFDALVFSMAMFGERGRLCLESQDLKELQQYLNKDKVIEEGETVMAKFKTESVFPGENKLIVAIYQLVGPKISRLDNSTLDGGTFYELVKRRGIVTDPWMLK